MSLATSSAFQKRCEILCFYKYGCFTEIAVSSHLLVCASSGSVEPGKEILFLKDS